MGSNIEDHDLKIAHWNANGLKEKVGELKIFLQEHDIDVMLINETKFTGKSKFKIPGYECFRKDRQQINEANPGGGVLILYKNSLNFVEIQCDLLNNKIETLGVKSGKLSIFSIYAQYNSIDASSLDTLFNSNQRVIAAGDFNARH